MALELSASITAVPNIHKFLSMLSTAVKMCDDLCVELVRRADAPPLPAQLNDPTQDEPTPVRSSGLSPDGGQQLDPGHYVLQLRAINAGKSTHFLVTIPLQFFDNSRVTFMSNDAGPQLRDAQSAEATILAMQSRTISLSSKAVVAALLRSPSSATVSSLQLGFPVFGAGSARVPTLQVVLHHGPPGSGAHASSGPPVFTRRYCLYFADAESERATFERDMFSCAFSLDARVWHGLWGVLPAAVERATLVVTADMRLGVKISSAGSGTTRNDAGGHNQQGGSGETTTTATIDLKPLCSYDAIEDMAAFGKIFELRALRNVVALCEHLALPPRCSLGPQAPLLVEFQSPVPESPFEGSILIAALDTGADTCHMPPAPADAQRHSHHGVNSAVPRLSAVSVSRTPSQMARPSVVGTATTPQHQDRAASSIYDTARPPLAPSGLSPTDSPRTSDDPVMKKLRTEGSCGTPSRLVSATQHNIMATPGGLSTVHVDATPRSGERRRTTGGVSSGTVVPPSPGSQLQQSATPARSSGTPIAASYTAGPNALDIDNIVLPTFPSNLSPPMENAPGHGTGWQVHGANQASTAVAPTAPEGMAWWVVGSQSDEEEDGMGGIADFVLVPPSQ